MIVDLPGGGRVEARSWRRARADWVPPDLGVYLGGGIRPPWPHVALAWPDFGLPEDRRACLATLRDAHRRILRGERVEIACRGGLGRTGTALAVLAGLGGEPSTSAVDWVRAHYHRRAVETPWQCAWAARAVRLLRETDPDPRIGM